jgi:hypothetical protein
VGTVFDEYGKWFHQDFSQMEKRYSPNILADAAGVL